MQYYNPLFLLASVVSLGFDDSALIFDFGMNVFCFSPSHSPDCPCVAPLTSTRTTPFVEAVTP